MVTAPVKIAPLKEALLDKLFVTVVEKLLSLPKALASSYKVSRASGAELITLAISFLTNFVLAI